MLCGAVLFLSDVLVAPPTLSALHLAYLPLGRSLTILTAVPLLSGLPNISTLVFLYDAGYSPLCAQIYSVREAKAQRLQSVAYAFHYPLLIIRILFRRLLVGFTNIRLNISVLLFFCSRMFVLLSCQTDLILSQKHLFPSSLILLEAWPTFPL